MRLRLDLSFEETQALLVSAMNNRRSIPNQAAWIIREALDLPCPIPDRTIDESIELAKEAVQECRKALKQLEASALTKTNR